MGAVDETFGAWFIGLQVASLLLGVSILQAWAFFSRARQDPVALKAVVRESRAQETEFSRVARSSSSCTSPACERCATHSSACRLLGVALSALASAGLYHFLVSSIGNPAALVEIPAYLNAEPFVNVSLLRPAPQTYADHLLGGQHRGRSVVGGLFITFLPLDLIAIRHSFYAFRLFRRKLLRGTQYRPLTCPRPSHAKQNLTRCRRTQQV